MVRPGWGLAGVGGEIDFERVSVEGRGEMVGGSERVEGDWLVAWVGEGRTAGERVEGLREGGLAGWGDRWLMEPSLGRWWE